MRYGIARLASLVAALLVLAACGGDEATAVDGSLDQPVEARDDAASDGVESTGHDRPTASGELVVVFTNNIDGEIEPCG